MKRKRFGKHWAAYFEDDVYRVRIEVLWPVTAKQIKSYVEHYYPEVQYDDMRPFAAKCVKFDTKGGTHVEIICLAEWGSKLDEYDYSFLAHECFHATSHILTRAGMQLEDFVSSEAYAFLMESIMRRCLVALNTRKPLPAAPTK